MPGPAAQRARIEAAFRPRGPSFFWSLLPIGLIWALAAAYFFLMPPVYHSKWSLILPASNNGSSVSLESIGQTSTAPTHPFGTVTLNPKAIYREIAGSEQVRARAAKALNMDEGEFGKARVKLIDETSLMLFRISGGSPEDAEKKGRALLAAFQHQLDVLRRDELEKRATFVRENLKVYRANLNRVREEMLEFQRKSGLLSLNQFKEAALSEELLRRRLAEQRTDLERLKQQHQALVERVGLSPHLAAVGVRLASNKKFERLATVWAEHGSKVLEARRQYGPRHPTRVNIELRLAGVQAELERFATEAGLGAPQDLPKLLRVFNRSNQSELYKSIIDNESQLAGRRREVAALEAEVETLSVKVKKLGKAAARLEALKKDHLVAEAVFTSAAARLDIGRTDLFASYPMVQLLSAPSLPGDRSQPRLAYAIAAGALGSILILIAWGALWFRSWFSRKH